MADRIVQLIDKDNNNIYPVAGSMADDSIMTAMLKDRAVTAAKLADGAVTENKIPDATVQRLYTVFYDTAIEENADLNTSDYARPGVYGCYTNAVAATLSNSPTSRAFRMTVTNITGSDIVFSADTRWKYLQRIITDIDGRMYRQTVTLDGSTPPVWTYGPWRETGQTITMTTTDPGEGSALAPGTFIGVYNA